MTPDLIASRVALLVSGALLFIGACTLNLPWAAVGFVLYIACGHLIDRADDA